METSQEHTMPERLLSLAEAQHMLGLSRAGLQNLIGRGELPTIRIGARRLVAPADLRRFVEARREGGEP